MISPGSSGEVSHQEEDTKEHEATAEASLARPPKLALVPLHPACRKQKLEAKEFPIVLGRTNLASWWWKSCPCQHYCRLHCRPVAQNIRSLSKVMIQIDSQGRVYVVGKNPHLITFTPCRGEKAPLQVNDIVSIGRRDREPWMRLQVVQKDAGRGLATNPSTRKAKTHTPEWMEKQTRQSSRAGCSGNTPRSNPVRAVASSNPPEWITTTRKRKSPSSRGVKQQPQRPATAIDSLQQAYANGNHLDSDPNIPARKRKRTRKMPAQLDDWKLAEKQPQQQQLKDRHPQVHLVFQDYETSAMLVRATQRQRSRSKTTPRTVFLTDDTKSQWKMLSQNFAEALRGAVANTDNADEKENHSKNKKFGGATGDSGSPLKNSGDGAEATEYPQAEQPDAAKPRGESIQSFEESLVEKSQIVDQNDLQPAMDTQPTIAMQPKNQYTQQEAADFSPVDCIVQMPAKQYSSEIQNTQRFDTKDQVATTETYQEEASMLFLPQCESSLVETVGASADILPGLLAAPATATDSKLLEKSCDEEASESSPASNDPVTELGPWREVVKDEEKKGNTSSFRHALASLVVAKNEKQQRSDGPLWLPSLLPDNSGVE